MGVGTPRSMIRSLVVETGSSSLFYLPFLSSVNSNIYAIAFPSYITTAEVDLVRHDVPRCYGDGMASSVLVQATCGRLNIQQRQSVGRAKLCGG